MLRKVSRQSIPDTSCGPFVPAFGFFVKVNSRRSIAEFELEPRPTATRQFANLFQAGPFRPISVANAIVTAASPVWRWMIRQGKRRETGQSCRARHKNGCDDRSQTQHRSLLI